MAKKGRPATGETSKRSVRVPDSVWKPAAQKAEREGKNVSDVVRRCLDEYAKKNGGKK